MITVPTTKSLRFAILWANFENCQVKTLLNSTKLENWSNRYGFLKILL